MRHVKLYVHAQYSNSAKKLAQALGIKRLKYEGSKYQPTPETVVINWGASDYRYPWIKGVDEVNPAECVKFWSNKLSFFEGLKDENVRIPRFTTNLNTARDWVEDRGKSSVMGRSLLQASSGRGILWPEQDGFEHCKLFVQYVPKKSEWRIHFCGSRQIFVQRKIKRPDLEGNPRDWRVRSHANGFIYQQNNEVIPEEVLLQAQRFIDVQEEHDFGLDFGALDIIYNEKNDNAYVLEVNTAPGLTGNTVTAYEEAFREMIR
jgi:hypothetical protein